MPKKNSHKKSSSSVKYRHFRLHGDHTMQKVLIFVVIDVLAGIVLGVLLQPYIMNFILTNMPNY